MLLSLSYSFCERFTAASIPRPNVCRHSGPRSGLSATARAQPSCNNSDFVLAPRRANEPLHFLPFARTRSRNPMRSTALCNAPHLHHLGASGFGRMSSCVACMPRFADSEANQHPHIARICAAAYHLHADDAANRSIDAEK